MDTDRINSARTHTVILLGIALGYSVAVLFLPGGYDALTFYLRAPFPNTTAPAWVYLITYPLSLLGWPLGWQLIAFITVLSAGLAGFVWGNKRWWIVMVSAPFLWTVWLGQIEFIPILGIVLTGLVLQKRIHIAWLGPSWLALMSKPQAGLGVLILQGLWLWREQQSEKRGLLLAVATFAFPLMITFVAWPDWLPNWLGTMRTFNATWWNASIWPYGLLVWPLVLYVSRNASRLQRARMFSAASLLGSPYFALYHCTTLLTLSDSVLALPLSWLIVLLGRGVPDRWMQWGWILPAGLLIADLITLAKQHRHHDDCRDDFPVPAR